MCSTILRLPANSSALQTPTFEALHDVVFTTGLVDGGDHYIVASGKGDLACRITHLRTSVFS